MSEYAIAWNCFKEACKKHTNAAQKKERAQAELDLKTAYDYFNKQSPTNEREDIEANREADAWDIDERSARVINVKKR